MRRRRSTSDWPLASLEKDGLAERVLYLYLVVVTALALVVLAWMAWMIWSAPTAAELSILLGAATSGIAAVGAG